MSLNLFSPSGFQLLSDYPKSPLNDNIQYFNYMQYLLKLTNLLNISNHKSDLKKINLPNSQLLPDYFKSLQKLTTVKEYNDTIPTKEKTAHSFKKNSLTMARFCQMISIKIINQS